MRFIFIALSFLYACNGFDYAVEHQEKHVIIQILKQKPVNIHDEISPKYRAVLENKDTISCTNSAQINDTIFYVFYQKIRFLNHESSTSNSTKNSR
jgi:hypothetical protein